MLYALIRESRERETIKYLYSLSKGFIDELKVIHQILDECEKRSYNPSKTLSKVLPYVIEIVEKYKNESSKLPPHISASFYEIYKSNMGKHEHYNEKRKEKNLRDLKISVGELLSYFYAYGEKQSKPYLELYCLFFLTIFNF